MKFAGMAPPYDVAADQDEDAHYVASVPVFHEIRPQAH